MGRRRLTSKAPKTPVRSRPQKESEEVLRTPVQELAMRGLCKEDLFFCSQQNSQIEVKWDCYSPDALQQIKQSRGRFADEDTCISEIVINMKLADEAGDIKSTEPLTGLWTSGKNEPIKQPLNKGLRRSARKRRSRRPMGTMKDLIADDLIDKLTEALNRHDSSEDENSVCPQDLKACPETDLAIPLSVIEEEITSQSSDNLLASPTFGPSRKQVINASTDLFESVDQNSKTLIPTRQQFINTSTDLFESANQNSQTFGPVRKLVDSTSADLFESADQNCKPSNECVKKNVPGGPHLLAESLTVDDEDEWSDDDLFTNTSLLMNQVVCSPPRSTRLSKRKSLMNSPSEPRIKTKRFTEGTVPLSTPGNQGKSGGLPSGEKDFLKINPVTAIGKTKDILIKNSTRETTQPLYARVTSLSNPTTNSTVSSSNGPSSSLKPDPVRNLITNLPNKPLLKKPDPVRNLITKLPNKPILKTVQKPQAIPCQQNQNGWSGSKLSTRNYPSLASVKLDMIPNSQRLSSNSTTQFTSSRTFKRHNTYPTVTASPKETGSSHLNGIRGQNKTNNWQSGYSNYNTTISTIKDCKNTNQSSHLLPNGQIPKTSLPSWSPANRSRRRSSIDSASFNNSLTDDLLCMLAEPDDLLDSQFDPEFDQMLRLNTAMTTCPVIPRNGIKKSFQESKSELVNCATSKGFSGPSTRSSVTSPNVIYNKSYTVPERCTKSTNPTIPYVKQTTHINAQSKSVFKNDFKKTTNTKGSVSGLKTLPDYSSTNVRNETVKMTKPAGSDGSIVLGTTNNNNNPMVINTDSFNAAPAQSVVPSQGQRSNQSGKYQFKSCFGNPKKPILDPKLKADLQNKNEEKKCETPHMPGATEKITSGNKVKETKSEFDDSFLTDDELSNPKVLAMIEEVEIQATQATKEPSSPGLKCTQEEIEKKKRAALELRQKRQKLQKKKPAVRQTSRQYKPLF